MIVLNNLPDCKSHIVICEGQDREKENETFGLPYQQIAGSNIQGLLRHHH